VCQPRGGGIFYAEKSFMSTRRGFFSRADFVKKRRKITENTVKIGCNPQANRYNMIARTIAKLYAKIFVRA
jgi:hypothetical protein